MSNMNCLVFSVIIFLVVNCGLSLMKRSMINVLHGGMAVVGYGNCLVTLNVTHCILIPLLGNCLPLLDEICRRSLNFIRSC
jgi:hypothetical protein